MTGTLTGSTCPPECRVRLKALEEWKTKTELNRQEVYKHWEGIVAMKVPSKTFFWVMGIFVVVLLGVFSAIYYQGHQTLVSIHTTQVSLAGVKQQVKANTDYNLILLKKSGFDVPVSSHDDSELDSK